MSRDDTMIRAANPDSLALIGTCTIRAYERGRRSPTHKIEENTMSQQMPDRRVGQLRDYARNTYNQKNARR
jgi:hypothetical protein